MMWQFYPHAYLHLDWFSLLVDTDARTGLLHAQPHDASPTLALRHGMSEHKYTVTRLVLTLSASNSDAGCLFHL